MWKTGVCGLHDPTRSLPDKQPLMLEKRKLLVKHIHSQGLLRYYSLQQLSFCNPFCQGREGNFIYRFKHIGVSIAKQHDSRMAVF